MKLRNIYLIILFSSVTLFSCTKDGTDDPVLKYFKVDDKTSVNTFFDIQFYASDSLFVGYNKVFLLVKEKSTGNPLNQADIDLHPVMDMGTFKHSCPVENPDQTADSEGFFRGAVLFSMPGFNNSWSLHAIVSANGKTDSVFFDIARVSATSPAKKIVVIDSLSNGPGSWIISKYPVSLVEPAEWKVGNNTFEITIHNMASRWSFPCCNEFNVEITPEMPSMGHGSPNNVNPVLTSNGHYIGKVNFTMTGAWRVNMVFMKGGRVIGKNAYFDIVF